MRHIYCFCGNLLYPSIPIVLTIYGADDESLVVHVGEENQLFVDEVCVCYVIRSLSVKEGLKGGRREDEETGEWRRGGGGVREDEEIGEGQWRRRWEMERE